MPKKKLLVLVVLFFLLLSLLGERYLAGAFKFPKLQFILVDENGTPLTKISKNVEVQVQIDALVPTDEVYKTIYYGTLKKPTILKFWDSGNIIKISVADQKIQSVISKWVEQYSEEIGTSFVISVWVLDYENKKLYRGFTIVNYEIKDMRKGFKKIVKVNIHKLPSSELPSNRTASIQGSNKQFYYWKVDWSRSWRPNDYIKIPILIVDNKYSSSGLINAWVDISREEYTNFDVTVAYGYKLSEKYDTPSLDIYSNGFPTIYGKFYFAESIVLGPNEKGYIYIYAKPYHLHEKEYYCTASLNNCVPTGEERIQEGINAIKTTGNNEIVGGSSKGLPDSNIMEKIYSGTTLKYATTLNVGDSKPLALLISEASGSCSTEFGIGLPVGALAVALSGGTIPPWAAGLSVGMHYSHSSSLVLYGGIKNYGELFGTGKNIQEYIYLGVSEYTYSVGNCNTKVPVGVYIESR